MSSFLTCKQAGQPSCFSFDRSHLILQTTEQQVNRKKSTNLFSSQLTNNNHLLFRKSNLSSSVPLNTYPSTHQSTNIRPQTSNVNPQPASSHLPSSSSLDQSKLSLKSHHGSLPQLELAPGKAIHRLQPHRQGRRPQAARLVPLRALFVLQMKSCQDWVTGKGGGVAAVKESASKRRSRMGMKQEDDVMFLFRLAFLIQKSREEQEMWRAGKLWSGTGP